MLLDRSEAPSRILLTFLVKPQQQTHRLRRLEHNLRRALRLHHRGKRLSRQLPHLPFTVLCEKHVLLLNFSQGRTNL